MVRGLAVRSFPYYSLQRSEVTPDREEFRTLSRRHNVIPIYTQVLADLDTPVSALLKIGLNDTCYLLESVEQEERVGRFSFLGNSASLVFSSHGQKVTVCTKGRTRTTQVPDPLGALEELMAQYHPAPVRGLPPFYGGAIGYLAYDAARTFIDLPDNTPDDLALPEMLFLLTDTMLVFDHANRTLQIVHNAQVEGDPDRCYDAGLAAIDAVLGRLSQPEPARPRLALPQDEAPFHSSFTRAVHDGCGALSAQHSPGRRDSDRAVATIEHAHRGCTARHLSCLANPQPLPVYVLFAATGLSADRLVARAHGSSAGWSGSGAPNRWYTPQRERPRGGRSARPPTACR